MPVLTIFAGINGAGKTTLYSYEKLINPDWFGERINPDEILVEFKGDWKKNSDILKSGKEAIRKIKTSLSKNTSFNLEVTLISNYVMNIMKIAKQQGYQVNVNFIGVSTIEQSLERIAKRVAQGGHGISEEFVRYRYENQFINFSNFFAYTDNALFFDNSQSLSIVASYTNKNLEIYDSSYPWVEKMIESSTKIFVRDTKQKQ